MSDGPAREWRFYLDDMIGFAEKVVTITDDIPELLSQLYALKAQSHRP